MRYQTAADLLSDLKRLRRDLESAAAMTAAASAAASAAAVMAARVQPSAAAVQMGAAAPLPSPPVVPAPAPVVPPPPRPVGPAPVAAAGRKAATGLMGILLVVALIAIGAGGAMLVIGRRSNSAAPPPAQSPAPRVDVPAPAAPPQVAGRAEPSAPSATPDAAAPSAMTGPVAASPPSALPAPPPQTDKAATAREEQAGSRVSGPRPLPDVPIRPRPGRAAGARAVRVPTPEEGTANALESVRELVRTRQFDAALTDLDGLIASRPTGRVAAEAVFLRATVLERMGRTADAAAAYDDVRQRYRNHPRAPEALMKVATLALQARRTGNQREAIALYDALATEYPGSPEASPALIAKAQLEEASRVRVNDPQLGEVPAALLTWRLLLQRYPSTSELALTHLATLYESIKRYDLAAQAYVDLGTRAPAHPLDPWFRAAELFERRVKDRDRARTAYANVPPSSPRYDRAQKKVRDLLR